MVSPGDPLPHDLAVALTQAGIDTRLSGFALQDALRSAIASRRGYCDWTASSAAWVVTLMSPERQTFFGRTLEAALARCLVWLMAPELGAAPSMAPQPKFAAVEDPAEEASAKASKPVKQPFSLGDRVIVVANEHGQRETLDLIGQTGKVRDLYPSPLDYVMECGVVLDGEATPRCFPPSALARLDPEVDDWND